MGHVGNIIDAATTTASWQVGDNGIVTDQRDNQDYCIGKLADDRVWMLDNLKLGAFKTDDITRVTLDSSNTDLDGAASDFASTWNNGISGPVQDAATHSNGECTSDSSYSKTDGPRLTCNGATSYNDNNDGFVAYSDPATGGTTPENCTAGSYVGTSPNSLTGCGYLYNWYTATAGSGKYSTTNTSATASICPAGWHLPYDTATNDFDELDRDMGGGLANWLYDGPFRGSFSGYRGINIILQGIAGYYWSARASGAYYAYYLQFSDSVIRPGDNTFSKEYGIAVRCIL
jgi:hypothetical protein